MCLFIVVAEITLSTSFFTHILSNPDRLFWVRFEHFFEVGITEVKHIDVCDGTGTARSWGVLDERLVAEEFSLSQSYAFIRLVVDLDHTTLDEIHVVANVSLMEEK